MKKLLSLFFAGCFLIGSHTVMAQAGDDYIVHYYYMFSDSIFGVESTTSEIVSIFDVYNLPVERLEKIDWLIYLALDETTKKPIGAFRSYEQ